MAKRCDICGKGSTKGAKRSHSNIKTLKRQDLNLQSKKIDGEKKKVCTGCLKNLKNKTAKK
ncbi:50S ribosomal protein L28 [Candidatus Falkowbacteria bacterium]|nr:50S ribosomal protein L28 [Candidatus Falkowbacteria bacterium]